MERGRKVDAKLREILRWGIPEPGGTGGGKGLPTSFLATALLSTQADVSAVLRDSLQDDPTGSGKERIAAALQAVAQDPLFVALLRETQARRDEAYTDKGAKKTAKGSVFKAGGGTAERNEGRKGEASEDCRRLGRRREAVAGSDGSTRTKAGEHWLSRPTSSQTLSGLLPRPRAAQSRRNRSDWHRKMCCVSRGSGLKRKRRSAKLQELAGKIDEAEQALNVARGRQAEADAALKSAEEAARAEGSDPGVTDTVVRQQLELRKSAADQAVREAQQRIDAALAAQKLVEAAGRSRT